MTLAEFKPVREASDDHPYGPWSGGSKASGGHPPAGGGGGRSDAYGAGTAKGHVPTREDREAASLTRQARVPVRQPNAVRMARPAKSDTTNRQVSAIAASLPPERLRAVKERIRSIRRGVNKVKGGVSEAVLGTLKDPVLGPIFGGALGGAAGYGGWMALARLIESDGEDFTEASDDGHHYGAWHGGSKASGGGPGPAPGGKAARVKDLASKIGAKNVGRPGEKPGEKQTPVKAGEPKTPGEMGRERWNAHVARQEHATHDANGRRLATPGDYARNPAQAERIRSEAAASASFDRGRGAAPKYPVEAKRAAREEARPAATLSTQTGRMDARGYRPVPSPENAASGGPVPQKGTIKPRPSPVQQTLPLTPGSPGSVVAKPSIRSATDARGNQVFNVSGRDASGRLISTRAPDRETAEKIRDSMKRGEDFGHHLRPGGLRQESAPSFLTSPMGMMGTQMLATGDASGAAYLGGAIGQSIASSAGGSAPSGGLSSLRSGKGPLTRRPNESLLAFNNRQQMAALYPNASQFRQTKAPRFAATQGAKPTPATAAGSAAYSKTGAKTGDSVALVNHRGDVTAGRVVRSDSASVTVAGLNGKETRVPHSQIRSAQMTGSNRIPQERRANRPAVAMVAQTKAPTFKGSAPKVTGAQPRDKQSPNYPTRLPGQARPSSAAGMAQTKAPTFGQSAAQRQARGALAASGTARVRTNQAVRAGEPVATRKALPKITRDSPFGGKVIRQGEVMSAGRAKAASSKSLAKPDRAFSRSTASKMSTSELTRIANGTTAGRSIAQSELIRRKAAGSLLRAASSPGGRRAAGLPTIGRQKRSGGHSGWTFGEATRELELAQLRLMLLGPDVPTDHPARVAVREATERLREAGDDHFYGAWKGGKASAGGHPMGGGGGGKVEQKKSPKFKTQQGQSKGVSGAKQPASQHELLRSMTPEARAGVWASGGLAQTKAPSFGRPGTSAAYPSRVSAEREALEKAGYRRTTSPATGSDTWQKGEHRITFSDFNAKGDAKYTRKETGPKPEMSSAQRARAAGGGDVTKANLRRGVPLTTHEHEALGDRLSSAGYGSTTWQPASGGRGVQTYRKWDDQGNVVHTVKVYRTSDAKGTTYQAVGMGSMSGAVGTPAQERAAARARTTGIQRTRTTARQGVARQERATARSTEAKNVAEYKAAVATRADKWVVGGGGREVPVTRGGKQYMYVFNPATGKHGYRPMSGGSVIPDREFESLGTGG